MGNMSVAVADLSGQDLTYWVARANHNGTVQEKNILRRHYAENCRHEFRDERCMHAFIVSKLGEKLPARETWQ